MIKYYGFPRTSRLRDKKQIQSVYAKGRVFADKDGVLYVFRRPDKDKARVAVAAGKKLGGAVVRNRLKRLMRESYRLCQKEINPGCDLLWIARRPLLGARFYVFTAVLLRLIKRAGLYGG